MNRECFTIFIHINSNKLSNLLTTCHLPKNKKFYKLDVKCHRKSSYLLNLQVKNSLANMDFLLPVPC